MKITVNAEVEKYKPVELTLVFESQDELDGFYEAMGQTCTAENPGCGGIYRAISQYATEE